MCLIGVVCKRKHGYLRSRRVAMCTTDVSLSVGVKMGCVYQPLGVFLGPQYCPTLHLADGFNEREQKMSKTTSSLLSKLKTLGSRLIFLKKCYENGVMKLGSNGQMCKHFLKILFI